MFHILKALGFRFVAFNTISKGAVRLFWTKNITKHSIVFATKREYTKRQSSYGLMRKAHTIVSRAKLGGNFLCRDEIYIYIVKQQIKHNRMTMNILKAKSTFQHARFLWWILSFPSIEGLTFLFPLLSSFWSATASTDIPFLPLILPHRLQKAPYDWAQFFLFEK